VVRSVCCRRAVPPHTAEPGWFAVSAASCWPLGPKPHPGHTPNPSHPPTPGPGLPGYDAHARWGVCRTHLPKASPQQLHARRQPQQRILHISDVPEARQVALVEHQDVGRPHLQGPDGSSECGCRCAWHWVVAATRMRRRRLRTPTRRHAAGGALAPTPTCACAMGCCSMPMPASASTTATTASRRKPAAARVMAKGSASATPDVSSTCAQAPAAPSAVGAPGSPPPPHPASQRLPGCLPAWLAAHPPTHLPACRQQALCRQQQHRTVPHPQTATAWAPEPGARLARQPARARCMRADTRTGAAGLPAQLTR